MSLSINDKIYIQNRNGVTKFDSNSALMYHKNSYLGLHSLSYTNNLSKYPVGEVYTIATNLQFNPQDIKLAEIKITFLEISYFKFGYYTENYSRTTTIVPLNVFIPMTDVILLGMLATPVNLRGHYMFCYTWLSVNVQDNGNILIQINNNELVYSEDISEYLIAALANLNMTFEIRLTTYGEL